jgi:DNA repair protein RadC
MDLANPARAYSLLLSIIIKPGQLTWLFFSSNHLKIIIMKQQTTSISEVKLIYRTKIKASDRLKVKCSRDAYEIFLENWDLDSIEHTEEFKILLMNRSNSVLGIFPVSKGGLSGTVTDVRLIYQAAIKANASGIIVCHNHPSGNLNPSESDSKITQKIKEAGNLMDIQLLDHLILTMDGSYYSFADNGLL